MARVGWSVVEPMCWRLHTGHVLDITSVSPWYMAKLAEKAVLAWQVPQVAGHPGLEHLVPDFCWRPLAKLLHGKTI
eukprot:9061298-Prorocentrum_lima.AAC.1